ncbi:MAG: type II toxin-antitoxin system Phd/YefM family antitoxin [Thermoanaerobaculia bacterium]
MTRIRDAVRAVPPGRRWTLQDAKARFSEVVRRAKTEGPQRVTVHGREEVVIVSVEDYRRVTGERSGRALVELMQASPLAGVDLDRVRTQSPIRDVDL